MDMISGISIIATIQHHRLQIAQKLINDHMYYRVYYTYIMQKIP